MDESSTQLPPAALGSVDQSVFRTALFSRAAKFALLAAAILFVYQPALHGAFIWDDYLYVANCNLIKAHDGLYRFWFTTEPIDYWPVSNSSLWVEWRLWGTNTFGYHLINCILHFISALLVWRILRTLAIPGAFLAAMLFAVHPVNVESVAWIAQRKGLMALCFALLSILCYLRAVGGAAEPRSRAGPNFRWYAISWLCFLLAMLSKGSVAMLPVAILLIVWWKRRSITPAELFRTVPFFVLAVVLTLVNVWFQQKSAAGAIRHVVPLERVADSGFVAWFYLAKDVLPLDLSFIYPQPKVDVADVNVWIPLAAAIFVTCVLFWKRRLAVIWQLLVAWLLFCLALLPVMGFTDVYFMKFSLVADHYQYAAIIPVVALAAAAWAQWQRRAAGLWRPAALLNACTVVGALAYLCRIQSASYAGPISTFEDALRENPTCSMAHNNLGLALFEAGKTPEAVGHYLVALQLDPAFDKAHNNLGNALLQMGRSADAIDHYQQAIALQPNDPKPHYNLGRAYLETGHVEDAIRECQRAVDLKPNDADARYNFAIALQRAGRPQDAIEQFLIGSQIAPDDSRMFAGMGDALSDCDKTMDAVIQYRTAVRLNPTDSRVQVNLGNALCQIGETEEAVGHYRQALQIEPASVPAHLNFGNALLQLGRPEAAISEYQQAIRLQPDEAEAWANLAIAKSQIQRTSEAIAAARKAIELATSQGNMALAQKMQEWLADQGATPP